MAPKRAAKKAAPPPPPPPPAASSEETDSRSRSEESEDEDAIAESPPPAPTPAPKNTRAPPQEGEEEEESDEEEEEEEESDEEPAHAAPAAAPTPKNQPPPPQQREDSDSSDEEEEEPTQAAPPSAPKKQPPPPPQRQTEESDASDEEEEEGESEEEEAPPPPKLALMHAPEGLKPPVAAETKKPAAFSRIWSTDDEVRVLEALAAHQKQHGTLPQPDALVDALAGRLDNRAYGSKELHVKVGTLKRRYVTLSKKGELPSKEHDRRVLELSKIVWGGDMTTAAAASAKAANGHEPKGFEEMCELYPYLAEQVKELDAANPDMFKREFGKMDDDKAHTMDEKFKRQRVAQMKVELRRHDLAREVTKAIIDLVD